MTNLRSNFAGTFYPANPQQLADQICQYLDQAPITIPHPKAILVPHAGIVYSGATAGFAYKQIENLPYERIIILAPSHQLYHRDLAIPLAGGVDTPLGLIRFDADTIRSLAQTKPFILDNSPHLQEHAIEVQYPFLQLALSSSFHVIPISVGDIDGDDIKRGAQQLATLMDEQTLLIMSSDLSHYHNKRTAEVMDHTTLTHILHNDIDGLIGSYQRKAAECCGLHPILLGMAVLNTLPTPYCATLLHYDTSASASFDDQHVVGYASIAFS